MGSTVLMRNGSIMVLKCMAVLRKVGCRDRSTSPPEAHVASRFSPLGLAAPCLALPARVGHGRQQDVFVQPEDGAPVEAQVIIEGATDTRLAVAAQRQSKTTQPK